MFYTFQDFEKATNIPKFVYSAIQNHKMQDDYELAILANEYFEHKNRTIVQYQKLLYEVSGKVAPDNYSANYKLSSNFFERFVTQQNQYLLGNGATFLNDSTKEKLGKDFDEKLQEAGEKALIEKVAFGFWNLDHLEVFGYTEFVPLYDEENGMLKAGIRFWQIDSTKPLRATLYEIDGYTDFIWRAGEPETILQEKRAYKLKITSTQADGIIIADGENYPTFPIVPLWANKKKQSEFVGRREQIDCYDLIKSGFANTVDEASYIYWTIQNAGGMDDVDLAKFVERMRTVHASIMEDEGAHAESHMIEAPYASREALLDRLRSDLYEDYMALDVKSIADGAVTATQIKSAYEPMNTKADAYEYCVIAFVDEILRLTGIDDTVTFTRSAIINTSEEIQNVIMSASYLESDYITEKLLNLLGDGDRAKDMIALMEQENINRMYGMTAKPEDVEEENNGDSV